jgi:hypothetical protein
MATAVVLFVTSIYFSTELKNRLDGPDVILNTPEAFKAPKSTYMVRENNYVVVSSRPRSEKRKSALYLFFERRSPLEFFFRFQIRTKSCRILPEN